MANLTIDEILEQVEILCRKHEVEHLCLFGSRANGTATETSDIDIIIKGGVQNEYLKEDMNRYGRKIY